MSCFHWFSSTKLSGVVGRVEISPERCPRHARKKLLKRTSTDEPMTLLLCFSFRSARSKVTFRHLPINGQNGRCQRPSVTELLITSRLFLNRRKSPISSNWPRERVHRGTKRNGLEQ